MCNDKKWMDLFQIPNLLAKLPGHSFWRAEKKMIATRYYLAKGEMNRAKRHFAAADDPDRSVQSVQTAGDRLGYLHGTTLALLLFTYAQKKEGNNV